MSRAVLFLADGFEEIEAVIPIDILRRGGVEVTLAGVRGKLITGAHGIRIEADEEIISFEDYLEYDAVVIPGGMPGSKNLSDSQEVNKLIISMFNSNKIVGAICAAPAVVLGRLGVLEGKTAVCYPGAEAYAPDSVFADYPVVTDGNLITAQGAGYAAEFGLEILKAIQGAAAAEEVGQATLFI
ncbi:MAG: DJ-1/PfpI family protein [Spirochaetia bacterium]|nr:DJ-1/PfpI family protein [Spirochaetia bacterium]